MRSNIKVRILRINDNKPEDRPRVMFKGSDAAHGIWQRTMVQTAPKGFRFVTQTALPDEQGFRTGFLDLTARAKALKVERHEE